MGKNKLLKDYYKGLKKKGTVKMPYNEFKALYLEGLEYISADLVKGNRFRLPHGLGQISFVGKRQKKPAIDWNGTKKMWETRPDLKEKKQFLYFMNTETEGLIFKLKWWRASTLLKNSFQYKLRAVWGLRDKLKKAIRDGERGYEVLHGFQKWKKAPGNGGAG